MNPQNDSAFTQDAIARRARQLWDDRGRPHGQDVDIWLEAERQLRAEAPVPPASTTTTARTRRRRTAADEIKPDEVDDRLDDFGDPPRRSATSVDLTR
jgi:Protein of unknown function (DUF2934).